MRTEPRLASELVSTRDRRQALASLLRSLLVATVVVVGYFVLPLASPLATDTVIELGVGIALVGVLLVWQIRSITRSPYPGAKAVGALTVTVPLFLVLFATAYFLMGRSDPSTFSEPLSRLDSLYFTVTVFATVGFGDIVATTETARAVTTLQMVGDLVLVGLIARVVVGAVQQGRQRRHDEHAPERERP